MERGKEQSTAAGVPGRPGRAIRERVSVWAGNPVLGVFLLAVGLVLAAPIGGVARFSLPVRS